MIINKHIKKIIIYTFLCIYSFALIKPVMPIANDIIAHTFFKMEHLATVHFENGKYHVHQELANDVTQKDNNKGTAPASIYETLANHLNAVSSSFEIHYSVSTASEQIPFKTTHPVVVYPDNTTPPPKV